MSRGARDLLREADALRARADELKKFAEYAEPAVGLTIKVGTWSLHNRDNIRVLIEAAKAESAALRGNAASLEAHVVVAP